MWQEDGDPLLKALANAGIDDILSLLILDEQQIDELKYDNSGTMTSLAPGHKNMVTIFLAYVCHRIIIGNPIIGNDYLSVTDADFEEYRQTDYMDLIKAAPTNPKAHDAVAGFFKGIQRQLNLFATLKPKKFQETEEVEVMKTAESESKVDLSSKPDPSLHTTATPKACDPVADFLKVIRHSSNLFLVLKDIKSHGEDKNNHWILEEVRGSQEGKPPEQVAYGPGNNNKKNVLRELEQPDLREKSAFVLKEYDTDLGQY